MTEHGYEVKSIQKIDGLGGQYAYCVALEFTDANGNVTRHANTFVGITYSDRVLMEWAPGDWITVTDADRFGPVLSRDWVNRFYGIED